MTDVDLWWAEARNPAARLVDLLDDEERPRLDRFVRPEDRDRFLVAHALARLVVADALRVTPADVRFDRSCARCGAAHGKPQVVPTHGPAYVSLTHSGRWVGVALCATGPVRTGRVT
ncbi:4'-phosphopantetheinyl transferase family protein [Micromonospora zhanjiangensis]|uniref:4'-phosphopantetheinyl transferase family protein n=1 Tax=Micromonospora zhanjiangensis TaxID=1522057 RepID=A0ABV8KTF7_9ACTN